MNYYYDTKLPDYSPNKDLHFIFGHSILHFPSNCFEEVTIDNEQCQYDTPNHFYTDNLYNDNLYDNCSSCPNYFDDNLYQNYMYNYNYDNSFYPSDMTINTYQENQYKTYKFKYKKTAP
jgi:hypothetical protein